jgi:ribosomal protein L34E
MADNDRPPEKPERWLTAPLPDGTLPLDPDPLPPLPPKWSAPLADAPADGVWTRFEQVKITCTTSMCDADLHCFLLTMKLAKILSPGSCRTCGKPLVSLQRTAERDLSDIDATFAALQRDCIRHFFWHVPFGQKALNYARRAGRIKLEDRIESRIRSRIGDAEPYRDGQQTPIAHDRADALDFAQHAVAACCRKCAQYWHGIPTGRPLDEDEVAYLSELVRRYLRARLPDLQDGPMKVPPIRRRAEVHHMAHSESVPPQDRTSVRRPHAS